MNEQLAHQVIAEALKQGVEEFCVCPGSRNSPFVVLLLQSPSIKKIYWFEERSAAFFALGRSRAAKKPVAVITTSGTACAELLPAAIEAYYSGIPLLLITADRPRRFRCTGAPQAIEQAGLYGRYVVFAEDLSEGEKSYLSLWNCRGPAHVNVCFEEPLKIAGTLPPLKKEYAEPLREAPLKKEGLGVFAQFLKDTRFPFVIVSALKEEEREAVAEFLVKLNAPVYLEAVSGLREDPRIAHLQIKRSLKLWEASAKAGYEIDGVLRIGGIPTTRFWRDLEAKQHKIHVLSLSNLPFPGLSWGNHIHAPINLFLTEFKTPFIPKCTKPRWLEEDSQYYRQLFELIQQEPLAEQSMVHLLSKLIPCGSQIYLGNSLPIREWDLAASWEQKGFSITASRGANGIDGQISTFLGLSLANRDNWSLLGDLTALYDMAGPWVLPQLSDLRIHFVVINNGGGKIFNKMYPEKEFQNRHCLSFKPLAELWGLVYQKWTSVPSSISFLPRQMIELTPDPHATQRFSERLNEI